MTDDLVKWLRETEDELYGATRCREAADRIEQLTERIRSSEKNLNEIVNGDLRLAEKTGTKVRYSPADERLVERVRKMEAALRAIAEAPVTWEIPSRTTVWGLAVQMQETAKDALKEGDRHK